MLLNKRLSKVKVLGFMTKISVALLIWTPLVLTSSIDVHAIGETNNITTLSIDHTAKQPVHQSSVNRIIHHRAENDTNNANEDILRRGIISSEPGQPEELKVQRTIILQHREDGKNYVGILTFTASKPVEVLLGHRLNLDNITLSNIDTKKFGDLFFVNPIHPNAGYVLSVPTVIKPDYRGSSPPYYSASIPFVASSVVLRTLGEVPFMAVYEVSAHLGQPEVTNNVTSANVR